MPEPTDVLACVDFSPTTAAVVDEAAHLARAVGGTLHLLHAAAPEPDLVGYDAKGGTYDRDRRAGELTDERGQLQEIAEAIEGLDVNPLIVMGPTVEVILDEAAARDSALIVVGSHGHRALHRLVMGSTTDALLRATTRPIVIVPAPDKR